ncbi:hypothetical protein SAMN05216201_108179 [Pseudomonas linyingensis]|uniref:Class I SAM-dependent methyltransferase n=1 Tax=Pseudomonas linyingensis TaxID=915471 RepID=A0A1H6YP57_9PSED|nr:hypothetical protein [Pseudomonas linyingensis]MCM2318884.1 class I SAM-dependent methyltransferase [Pseudomonas sp.]SEJ43108.1 hypothetical protein SAMN05216201_108179 [Pseudomonas linyingensis]
MNSPQPLIRLAPITTGLVCRNPRVLLAGQHQPTLLRYLDGWPKRWSSPRTFLIQFARSEAEDLQRFAPDHFDFAVIHAPCAEQLESTISALVRVARQGLITRRQG